MWFSKRSIANWPRWPRPALYGGSADVINRLLDERAAFARLLHQSADEPNEFRTAAGPLTTEQSGSIGGP